jgi:hypothetical protein
MTRTIRGLLDRLAQRMPVRFKLDDVPSDLLLVAGRTATVSDWKDQMVVNPQNPRCLVILRRVQ